MKNNKHHCIIGGVGKDCRKEMFLSVCSSLALRIKSNVFFLYVGEDADKVYSFLKTRYVGKASYYGEDDVIPYTEQEGLLFKECRSDEERNVIIDTIVNNVLEEPFKDEVLLCVNETHTSKVELLKLNEEKVHRLLMHNMRYVLEHTGQIKEITILDSQDIVVNLFDCY